MRDNIEKKPNLNTLDKVELAIVLFNRTWIKWTTIIVFGCLFLIFLIALIRAFFNPPLDNPLLATFDALQIWSSFGLGTVAMIFSIFSMVLSFYNLEKQIEESEKSERRLERMKSDIVRELKHEVQVELESLRKEIKMKLDNIEENTMVTKNFLHDSVSIDSENNKKINKSDYIL